MDIITIWLMYVEREKGGVEGYRTVLTITAINLKDFLVTVDVDLDTAPGALESCYRERLVPVVGAILLTVDEVRSICYNLSVLPDETLLNSRSWEERSSL
jgi:hypothetical protein